MHTFQQYYGHNLTCLKIHIAFATGYFFNVFFRWTRRTAAPSEQLFYFCVSFHDKLCSVTLFHLTSLLASSWAVTFHPPLSAPPVSPSTLCCPQIIHYNNQHCQIWSEIIPSDRHGRVAYKRLSGECTFRLTKSALRSIWYQLHRSSFTSQRNLGWSNMHAACHEGGGFRLFQKQ